MRLFILALVMLGPAPPTTTAAADAPARPRAVVTTDAARARIAAEATASDVTVTEDARGLRANAVAPDHADHGQPRAMVSLARNPLLRAVAGPLPLASRPAAAAAAPSSPDSRCAGASFVETFDRDPLARHGTGVLTGPGRDQFAWDAHAGALHVHFDSSRPTTRLAFPLGLHAGSGDCFRFGAVLTLDRIDASSEDFFAISLGLANSSTTGFNRTGTFPLFGDADTFDFVEASYFPNVTAFGGPFLTPTIFGRDTGTGDAFANFATLFGPPADLGDNLSPLVRSLPTKRRLQVEVRHDGATRQATLTVIDLSGVRPEVVETGLIPLDASLVDDTAPFDVDEIAVTSFFDAADFDPSTTSIVADVTYDEVYFDRCCETGP